MENSSKTKDHVRNTYDYRYGGYGLSDGEDEPASRDISLMTYKGHRVANTLIRCYFSPSQTTGTWQIVGFE